jgi:hypothetical protein
MATITKPTGTLRKLATSALGAIAIELLKAIPIIGPSISVGIGAIWNAQSPAIEKILGVGKAEVSRV